jgi:hypothetical protein
MRLHALLFAAMLWAPAASAQEPAVPPAGPAPAQPPSPAPAPGAVSSTTQETPRLTLPVSIERIRKELEQKPLRPLFGLRETPTFKIEVQERNRLQDLIANLDFRSGPAPAGGLYAAEMQRVMFPSVSNPLRQPFAAFNQPELLTILIQTIAGKYLAGRALNAITNAERAAAEEAARQELRRTIRLYCAAQPNNGAGIDICTNQME